MPCLSWELLFLMLFMLFKDNKISLNLELVNTSNCVVIMIIIMAIYICVYECHYLISL